MEMVQSAPAAFSRKPSVTLRSSTIPSCHRTDGTPSRVTGHRHSLYVNYFMHVCLGSPEK